MVLVSLVIPANLVVAGPLRSVGSASRIFGLVALGFVLLVFLQRDVARATWGKGVRGAGAVPVILLLYLTAIVGLYGASYRRLMSPEEIDGGTRTLFGAVALVGTGLAVALLVSGLQGLRIVIGSVVIGAGFSAFVGILQSRISLDLAATLKLPGLVVNREVQTGIRNELTRVLGSAGHPIEFSVILAGAVPLALYVATYGETKRGRQWAIAATVLMLSGVPLGVSRSGILGIGVAILCYGVVWTWRQRLTALAIAGVGLVVYRVLQPGVLGTIAGLFTNASTDSSITARTNDYPRIEALLSGREFLGIGPGTFNPDVYFVLDNQYLLSYVEGGFLGVAAFLLIPLTGLVVAQIGRRRSIDRRIRDAAQAIFAAIAATTACAATFDVMSFQQASFVLFVYSGLAGAVLVVASTQVQSTRADANIDSSQLAGAAQ